MSTAKPQASSVTAVSLLQGDSVGVHIIAALNVGLRFHTLAVMADQLAKGRSVIVFDAAGNYSKAAEAVGGVYLRLCQSPPGGYDGFKHGDAPLVVYDFERLDSPYLLRELPVIAGLGEAPLLGLVPAPGIVIVDDAQAVLRRFPGILEILQDWSEQGAAFCITGQTAEDVAAFRGLAASTQTLFIPAA